MTLFVAQYMPDRKLMVLLKCQLLMSPAVLEPLIPPSLCSDEDNGTSTRLAGLLRALELRPKGPKD